MAYPGVDFYRLDERLDDVELLPDARGLEAPLSCLNEAWYGIAWGAVGGEIKGIQAFR